MKTEISTFCETCLLKLEPLPGALQHSVEQMEGAADPKLFHHPLATLNDIRARLRSLVEKLADQQAYLLIFGPLKSGKSTLMNAISGSYVSEVTSLPGYPCLVFVRHSDAPRFSATRYNGRETVFADGRALKDVIADSHVALAEQIRATEQRGEDFNPGTHFPETIRRIDVKVPVPSLAESSTVLVDTPGLYSRMNFGYDVLTREFRDSAACAVFVVKTDNLFLEQVFAEFNQLLGLFSRIFLLINVDSGKRDLQPDGSLQPSAESQNPEQIIEAFKTLSMAGPLRRAYEEKRVRLHAVDLLSAASSLLSPASSSNGSNGQEVHPGSEKQKQAFQNFLEDLTDYLNSSDYTTAFVGDSLRQGSTLCTETRAVCEGEEVQELRHRQEVLHTEINDLSLKIEATDRLLAVDWTATFDGVRGENSKRSDAEARDQAAKTAKELGVALDEWYSSGDSLKTLAAQRWSPLLLQAGKVLTDSARSRLRLWLGNALGGSEPAALVMNDLHTVGFQLGPVAESAAPLLEQPQAAEVYDTKIDSETIPVRKSFGDWILFRKLATVRQRLFGEDLSAEIAPEIKQKRLTEPSRQAFETIIADTVKAKFPSIPAKTADNLLGGYVAKFRDEMLNGLRALKADLNQQRTERQTPFDAGERILRSLEALETQTNKVARDLEALVGRDSLPAVDEAPAPTVSEAASELVPA